MIVAVKISIIHAVVLLGVSLVVISVLNNTISRRTMRKMQKDGWSIDGTENAIQKQYYYTCYNHECDVVSSVIAEIGVVVNMMIIAAFFVF